MSNATIFQRATSLSQALDLLATPGPDPTLLAGGTDVLVWLQSGRVTLPRILDIWGVRPECAQIHLDDDTIVIGALASYAEIIRSPVVQTHLPLLVECAKEIGAAQIQSRGTLGGNIGGSSPAGDSLPVLLAYGADVVLESRAGTRTVPYASFYTGYRSTVRRSDEMITAVRFPRRDGVFTAWYKGGTRLAQAISKVMVAGLARFADNGTVAELRLGVGSVAPVPVLLERVAAHCVGALLDEQQIAGVRALVAEEISPIDDVRSTAAYRNTVTANLVVRFLRDALASAQKANAAPQP